MQVGLGEMYGSKVVKLALCVYLLDHHTSISMVFRVVTLVQFAYVRTCGSSSASKKRQVGSGVTLVEVDKDGINGTYAPI